MPVAEACAPVSAGRSCLRGAGTGGVWVSRGGDGELGLVERWSVQSEAPLVVVGGGAG